MMTTAEEASQGVSNCYVFKSRLQEYAQKVGLTSPVYETIKEGPSHEPTFRSTVVVNDVRYDSLPGFFNRKAAEQSAAEVALVKMAKSGEMKDCDSEPLNGTGLCKNLLQEYAQKMNFAIPLYECRKDEATSRGTLFSCTIEIGGIRYIGASARTKKEAEIKAARTALLAIQYSSSEVNKNLTDDTEYTVLPFKKKPANSAMGGTQEPPVAAALKPKKRRFKKNKNSWKKSREAKAAHNANGKNTNDVQVTDPGFPSTQVSNNIQNGNGNAENSAALSYNGDSRDGNLTSLHVDQSVLQGVIV